MSDKKQSINSLLDEMIRAQVRSQMVIPHPIDPLKAVSQQNHHAMSNTCQNAQIAYTESMRRMRALQQHMFAAQQQQIIGALGLHGKSKWGRAETTTPKKEEPKPPAPSRWRAVMRSISDSRSMGTFDTWLIPALPFYLYVMIFTARTMLASVIALMFMLGGICAVFKRGRMAVKDWKNQQLAYFTGVIPKEKLEIYDRQTEHMFWVQLVILLAGFTLIIVQYATT